MNPLKKCDYTMHCLAAVLLLTNGTPILTIRSIKMAQKYKLWGEVGLVIDVPNVLSSLE